VIVPRRAASAASACGLALALAGCLPTNEVGYVEIKTVPVAPVTQAALYLDATKVGPIQKGTAVLRQPVGTIKLQVDAIGGQLATLCNVVVKKNRITTVTVSVLERPPRCQCRFPGGPDSLAGRTCVS
jgi:hypothetical protein